MFEINEHLQIFLTGDLATLPHDQAYNGKMSTGCEFCPYSILE